MEKMLLQMAKQTTAMINRCGFFIYFSKRLKVWHGFCILFFDKVKIR